MSDTQNKPVSNSSIRIALPAILTAILFVGVIFLVFFPDLENEYIARKKEMLSEVTETAWSILNSYENRERQGLLTRDEAQQLAKEQIRVLRYGANRLDYFWLTNMQHRMIMHPYQPELEGMDMTLTDDVDDKGAPLFVEFVRVIRESGEGFVRYNWQWKNDPDKISPKLSFVKGFAPWDWYIGTGVYLDDVMAEIAAVKRRILSIIGGILLLVFSLTIYIVRQTMLVETNRRKTENALLKSEKRFKELANSLPQFVFETDLEGNFTFANRFFLEINKYTPEDIKNGVSAVNAIVPEERPLAAENIQRVLKGEKIGNIEHTALTKDGHTYPVLLYAAPLVDSGTIVGIRGMGIDLTEQHAARAEREKLERQIRQNMKMETIGTLAGGIAHDFNNILAAILGYADLAKGDLAPNDPNGYNINQILRAGYRAKDLVKQILTFSRQGERKKQPLQLDLLVKEACKFLRASIPATIDIELETTASPRSLILADATQVHQVILNLCTNAAQAMKQSGGRIHIRLSEETLDGEGLSKHPDITGGTYLKLEVGDTGPGISPDIIDQIFDPFFTTKERGEGTGMGLSMVHGIVKNHGGHIEAASHVGEGATFTVYFPVHYGAADRPVENNDPPPRGSERILLVDDEEMIVTMSNKLFKYLGYDIVTTTHGHEALEMLRSEPKNFDLLITDLTMPDLTGLELAKEARKIRPDIPVILCTGFADQLDPMTLESTGIAEVVLKPPLTRDFATAVRRAIDNNRQDPDRTVPGTRECSSTGKGDNRE